MLKEIIFSGTPAPNYAFVHLMGRIRFIICSSLLSSICFLTFRDQIFGRRLLLITLRGRHPLSASLEPLMIVQLYSIVRLLCSGNHDVHPANLVVSSIFTSIKTPPDAVPGGLLCTESSNIIIAWSHFPRVSSVVNFFISPCFLVLT